MATGQMTSFRAVLVTATLLLAVPGVFAAPVTYTEIIADVSDAPIFDFLDGTRDLRRTRTLGSGAVSVENDDSIIALENLVSDGWGLGTFLPFTLTHTFVADPAVSTFLSASLTLDVFGADGFPDLVFVDFPIPFGILTPAGIDGMSSTVVSSAIIPDAGLVDFVLAFLLADGLLNVSVVPLLLDFVSIRASTLSVTYEPASIPEPLTALLMLGGLFAAGRRHVRRRQRQSVVR